MKLPGWTNIAASLRLFGDVISRLPDWELRVPRVIVSLPPAEAQPPPDVVNIGPRSIFLHRKII